MSWLRRRLTTVKNRLLPRGLILMYHRISEPDLDPWGLSVSPDHFAEQLEVIRKFFNPIRMQELPGHLERGKVPNRSVIITFDDGYVDNLQHAKPLLERFDVPATIFLVTEAIREGQNFWWDELEWTLLQPGALPQRLELRINDGRKEWELGDARWYGVSERREDRQRRPWDARPGTRLAFFYSIWQHLLELSKAERMEALNAIHAWAGASHESRNADRALRREEVSLLGEGHLIELGAHTLTHTSLRVLSTERQREEIAGSKAQLENMISRPVLSFSYPHGEYSRETLTLVRSAGFQSASTTNFQCVRRDADPFQLPRFQVDDWNGEQFLRRLTRWYALS